MLMLHTLLLDFTGIQVVVSEGELVFLGLRIEVCLLIRRITVCNHDIKGMVENVHFLTVNLLSFLSFSVPFRMIIPCNR